MGVMLKIFLVFAMFGLAQVAVLLARGVLDLNIFTYIQNLLVRA
jgi:hypothetical protein